MFHYRRHKKRNKFKELIYDGDPSLFDDLEDEHVQVSAKQAKAYKKALKKLRRAQLTPSQRMMIHQDLTSRKRLRVSVVTKE